MRWKQLLLPALFVVGIAIALRLGFAILVLGHLSTDDLEGNLNPDSRGYVRLAGAVVRTLAGGGSSGGASGSLSLVRTPGYPAFCSLFYALGVAPQGIVIAQALLAAIVPLVAFLLTSLVTRSRRIGLVAGVVSALSPTGIGLAGIVLADMLLAVIFCLGFLFLYLASRGDRQLLWASLAGLAFGSGALIKPILVAWPLVSGAIWVLFARGHGLPLRWRPLSLLLAIQISLIGLWCGRNYDRFGVFGLSSIGAITTRYYWAVQVETWADAGAVPGSADIRSNRREAQERHRALGRDGRLSERETIAILLRESADIFRAHPGLAARGFLHNVRDASEAGWDYFRRQLGESSALIPGLDAATAVESWTKRLSLVMVLPLLLGLFLAQRRRPSADGHRLLFFSSGAILAISYFAVCSGITYWTGPRILYPVEFLEIAVIAVATSGSLRLLPGKSRFIERGGNPD